MTLASTPRTIPMCRDCRHSVNDGPALFCRYNPPTATIVMVPQQTLAGPPQMRPVPLASFPPVSPEQSCSKFADSLPTSLSLEH